MTGRGDLPAIGYADRADRLRSVVTERELGALVVLDMTNVRWLTGFTGSNAAVALLPDRTVLVTDGRYRDRAADELAAVGVDADIEIGLSRPEQRERLVTALRSSRRVGLAPGSVSHARWTDLATDVDLVAADGIVDDARRSKDAGEIARIAEACRCADAALAEVAPLLGDGMTEADVRTELEYRMRRHGADGPSYDTIVASGPEHAARPHHEASGRVLAEGDTVVIDVGALVDGYHSDMTRSYVIGGPAIDQTELYDLLLGVQLAGIDAVRAGVPAVDVDSACRDLIAEAGYADWFIHGTGHGVGLQIHEEPFESQTSTATLRAGDVVTVEPGLYRVGFGGFRIEDLVEVTEDGCRVLTGTPKDSPCLPSPPTT
jgi:Xaa-Pro aminopeptidase